MSVHRGGPEVVVVQPTDANDPIANIEPGKLRFTPFELPSFMATLEDGSSYLDRHVEGVIEAEGFAASRRLLFLHLTLSGPRRLSRSSGMCSRIGGVTTLSKLGEARAKKKLRELNKCVVEFHSRCHFSAALKENH
jgi:hypothetical protein